MAGAEAAKRKDGPTVLGAEIKGGPPGDSARRQQGGARSEGSRPGPRHSTRGLGKPKTEKFKSPPTGWWGKGRGPSGLAERLQE